MHANKRIYNHYYHVKKLSEYSTIDSRTDFDSLLYIEGGQGSATYNNDQSTTTWNVNLRNYNQPLSQRNYYFNSTVY